MSRNSLLSIAVMMALIGAARLGLGDFRQEEGVSGSGEPSSTVGRSGSDLSLVAISSPQSARLAGLHTLASASELKLRINVSDRPDLTRDWLIAEIQLSSGRRILANLKNRNVEGNLPALNAKLFDQSGLQISTGSVIVASDNAYEVSFSSQPAMTDTVDLAVTRYLSESDYSLYGLSGLNSSFTSSASSEISGAFLSPTLLRVSGERDVLLRPGEIPVNTHPSKPRPSRPGDINGDGIPDWDYAYDTPIPGTDMIVDIWVIDKRPSGAGDEDNIVTVIGFDQNGNGRLEAGEVSAIVGECIYLPGSNRVYVKDGRWVNHDNTNPRTGKRRHYIFDIQTGILKVYNENGNLIYQGPPSGYPW